MECDHLSEFEGTSIRADTAMAKKVSVTDCILRHHFSTHRCEKVTRIIFLGLLNEKFSRFFDEFESGLRSILNHDKVSITLVPQIHQNLDSLVHVRKFVE